MSETVVDSSWVGRKVAHASRPEWGVGTVLRVQPVAGQAPSVQRVSVQFQVGHRTLLVPPARLIDPPGTPAASAGWLDQVAKQTPDDRLRSLPSAATEILGSIEDRILGLSVLYAYDADDANLLRWARDQTQLADPLAHWSRDQLHEAFEVFRVRRDARLKELVRALRKSRSPAAFKELLGKIPADRRAKMQAAVGVRRG